jgi:hypothetical protein
MMGNVVASLWVYPLCLLYNITVFVLASIFLVPSLLLHLVVNQFKFDKTYPGLFSFLSSIPFGTSFFSSLIGVVAPYSASIGATVTSLTSTSCSASITERPWLRNPFSSLHAVALTNLGELTSGLATLSAIEATNRALREGAKKEGSRAPLVRGIVTEIRTVYHKKARGVITSKSDVSGFGQTLVKAAGKGEQTVDLVAKTDMTDAKGVLVAECFCTWQCQIVNKDDKKK